MKPINTEKPQITGGQPPNPRGLSLWGFRKRVMSAAAKKSDAYGITPFANLCVSARVAPLRCPIL